MSKTELHENPLVPNKKLRQMYVAMAEARALNEHVEKLQRSAKGRRRLDSTRGQEACRVSTVIDLEAGDLVSDSQVGVVTDLLMGEKASSLLKRAVALCSGKKIKGTKTAKGSGQLLPWISDGGERLRMAMGAALSFKTLGRRNVVVTYLHRDDVSKGDWARVLSLASKLELPVLFVVLASKGKKAGKSSSLSNLARRWGVPGIPVDVADAVALYRVAQESSGRMRGGDGPVLIECLELPVRGKGERQRTDPLVQLGEVLVARKICTRAWLKDAGSGLRRRIHAEGR
ncbi:MAG: thiamine pyrophosphate-dependent enzyme [Edaphobacter sp.]